MEHSLAALRRTLQGLQVGEITFEHFHIETLQIAPIRAATRQHSNLPLRAEQASRDCRADESGRPRHQRLHARCAPMTRNERIAIR